jgi:hypothetical protein
MWFVTLDVKESIMSNKLVRFYLNIEDMNGRGFETLIDENCNVLIEFENGNAIPSAHDWARFVVVASVLGACAAGAL